MFRAPAAPFPPAGAPVPAFLPAGRTLAVLLFLASAWPTRLSMVDDAYVSARYAAHLAVGDGLVYNAGQPPVEGYTDFLWVLLMAPGTRLPLHYATWATTWGLVFGASAVLLASLTAARLLPAGSRWSLAPAFILALLPHFGIAATNGLETSLFVAGVLGCVWAVLCEDRAVSLWAVFPPGLLYLIRPEGLVVGGWVAGWSAWRRRTIRPLLGWAAVVVPYFVGRTLYFGTWVPNTWHAQAREDFAGMWAMNQSYFLGAWPVWIGVGPLLGCVGFGVWRGPQRAGLILVLVPALVLTAISLQVYNWMPGLRLLLPSISLVVVGAAAVLGHLPWRRPMQGVVALGLVWLAWLTLGPPRTYAAGYDEITTVLPDNGGERLGRAIAAVAPPGGWLLARDAGVVPYYAGVAVNVIDIHPYSLTDPTLTGHVFDLDHILDRDVAFLVTTGKTVGEDTVYPEEKRLLADRRVRGRLVRGAQVQQHYGRFFTVWSPVSLAVDLAVDLPAPVSLPAAE